MAGHAKLSPSAAKRWMNCPGSVALIGDESSTTNQAAMMGTAAHKIIEEMVIKGETDVSEYAGAAVLVKADGDEESEIYRTGTAALEPENPRPGWFMFMVDEKMVEGCQQTIDEVERLRLEMYEPEVFSERFLDMTWLDSRLGGTADITLVEPFGWAHLVDHKNGYILVDHEDNDQLKQYAVGVAHEHPDCEGVRVTISQPNAPHVEGTIRTAEYTLDELKLYEIRMKEAADATSVPNAPLRAGDWCTFCPAKTRCKEFDSMLLEEATADFADDEPPMQLPLPNSTEELAHKAKWLGVIEGWVGQIKGDIQRELENGNSVEGWKLVRGGAKRKLLNPAETQRVFVEELGVPDEDLWVEPKMKTPAQLEKLGVGKEQRKLVKAKIRELAFMPEGKLTIAPTSDPREAASSLEDAQNEFAIDSEEDDDFA
jgi:hypothetical protein